MNQNPRLYLLALISVVIFFIYGFISHFTLVLKFCWEASELWFNNGNLVNPYSIFSIIFFLLFVWAGFELFILYKKKSVLSKKTLSIICIVLFLSSVSFVHYRLYQSLEVTRGEAYFYDIWPNANYFGPKFIEQRLDGKLNHWDFLFQEVCATGIDPHELSRSERSALYEEYIGNNK